MALWSKKPATHTNAPRHWPKIELDQFENQGINLIMIGGQLASLVQPPKVTLAFMRDFLYDDGILRVPIVVEEKGVKTCVFTYSKNDPDAAAHYSGVRALVRAREQAGAVYYGPEALTPTKPAVVLQPIDTPFFSKDEEQKDADFALWWATEEAPRFTGSEERVFLDRWFESLDGYGFLILTAFLRDLDLAEGKDSIYALPAQPLLQPLTGPGDTRMLLHASDREGLFLAFDEATAPSRRRLLLKLLADFAVQYRRAIEARGLAPRAEEKGPGLAAWRAIRDAAFAKEERGETGLKLHAVTVRDGQPHRDPSASGARDRETRPKPPGREELDFGMDLLERVLARLKPGETAGSSDQVLGGPNFFPVIAARVGADVVERQLPLEDAPVAQAAAGRALDEWPEAEIVAVLADAAVRENGARIDVFDLKIEHRKQERAAALVQRYRVADGGALELVGRPTATPAERFLLPAGASREPAPEPSLTALAHEALKTIVASLTVLEPSGICGDDPDDVLLSPSALVGRPGDQAPLTVRFMMQGPITAAMSCYAQLQQEPAEWVVFHLDDLVSRNGIPDRRLRLCVQRRQDPGMAVFDQRYETPRKGKAFALRGGLEFKRWGGSMFPPAS
jgi:hypothetical protein